MMIESLSNLTIYSRNQTLNIKINGGAPNMVLDIKGPNGIGGCLLLGAMVQHSIIIITFVPGSLDSQLDMSKWTIIIFALLLLSYLVGISLLMITFIDEEDHSYCLMRGNHDTNKRNVFLALK